jgi:UDP-glucose 4-epimerase
MNQILQGKPMSVFGDGKQTRAFSYIDDVAPVIADSIDVPGAYNQIFNIGADQHYSVNELAEAVARAMGVQPNIAHLPARNEVMHAYSSHEKIRRIFGERELVRLGDGLSRMAEWVKVHGARSSQKFGEIEIEKNFPKAWLA